MCELMAIKSKSSGTLYDRLQNNSKVRNTLAIEAFITDRIRA